MRRYLVVVITVIAATFIAVPRASAGDAPIGHLGDTLRAYLALPADWARSHRLSDGSTPAETLERQLADLEHAANGMRDAAVGRDATALLVNGRFLSDRFAQSSLDL